MLALATLALVSMVVFLGIYAIGNPVYVLADPSSPPEALEATIRQLGLDQPLHVQYWRFVSGAVNGRFAVSYVHGQPAFALIAKRLPATLEIVVPGLAIAALVGFPLGLLAGYWGETAGSRAISTASALCISLPTFWIALFLILVFSLEWRLLPTGGRGETYPILGIEVSLLTASGWTHVILPAMTLSLFPMALIVRLTRAGVREHRRMNYVRLARAMGIPSGKLLFAYIVPNVLIPVAAVLGLVFGTLVAFAVVTEGIFSWPGMGKLILDSIKVSDRPVIVAYLLFVVALFLLINLLVDLIGAVLDPRIRLGQRE
jgi:peptide/nickel transport system permease protein